MIKIAHRSGPVIYPEQTVKSALHALQSGADMVEIDLRLSLDGVPIVSHDDNTARVFGDEYRTFDIVADKFVSLTHKNKPEFHGHILQDYIDAGVKPLLLHIKEGGNSLKYYLKLLEENNYLENVVFGVSNYDDIEFLKDYNPCIKVLCFLPKFIRLDEFLNSKADYIRIWQGQISPQVVEKIHSAGKDVWIMVGNTNGYECGETDPEFIKSIPSSGYDGILINNIKDLI